MDSNNINLNLNNPFMLAYNQNQPPKTNMGEIQNRQIKSHDWKKSMSDKLMRRIGKQRQLRMDNIRMNKEEIIQAMLVEENEENFETPPIEVDMLSDLFEKFMNLFENKIISDNDFTYELEVNSNLSICPLCYDIVISTPNKVVCLSLCFQFNIPENLLGEYFTLDNFIDLFNQTLKSHKNCFVEPNCRDISLLIFENDINFICVKCLKQEEFYNN